MKARRGGQAAEERERKAEGGREQAGLGGTPGQGWGVLTSCCAGAGTPRKGSHGGLLRGPAQGLGVSRGGEAAHGTGRELWDGATLHCQGER